MIGGEEKEEKGHPVRRFFGGAVVGAIVGGIMSLAYPLKIGTGLRRYPATLNELWIFLAAWALFCGVACLVIGSEWWIERFGKGRCQEDEDRRHVPWVYRKRR